jgi:hypothetical protein
MANQKIRLFVTTRAFGCCEYCMSQEKYASQSFSIEHIIPQILGGTSDFENLALACQGCNNFKYTKLTALDNETSNVVTLFNPRQHKWTEHLQWNNHFTVVIGITPIGRATVKALQLNRDNLINQRIVYRAYGVHPPSHSLISL